MEVMSEYVVPGPVVPGFLCADWALDGCAGQHLAGVQPIRGEIAARVIGHSKGLGAQIIDTPCRCTQ
jgi:hypothetical protein